MYLERTHFWYYIHNFLARTEEVTQHFSPDNRFPGRESKLGPPEYVITIHL
jgi:hypothetical protein